MLKNSKILNQILLENKSVQEFFLEYGIYGCLIWQLGNSDEVWIDKRFANDFKIPPGIQKLSKLDDQHLLAFISSLTASVEKYSQSLTDSNTPLASEHLFSKENSSILEFKIIVNDADKLKYGIIAFKKPVNFLPSQEDNLFLNEGGIYDISNSKMSEGDLAMLAAVPIKTIHPVLITDRNQKILFSNHSFEKLSGYELGEIKGKKPSDFLHGEGTLKQDKIDFRKKVKAKVPFTQEILNYDKNNNPYLVSCFINPVFNTGGEVSKFISIQKDITEESKRSKYLEAFKDTLDQIEESVFLFDGDTLAFFYVNKGALNMMEYSEEEILKLHPYDIKPEYHEDRFKEFIEPLQSGALQSKRFKTIHQTKYGKEIPVEVFLQYIHQESQKPHFIAIVQDISDRIEEKKELERLSLVAENTTNLVVVTDASGRTEYVNKAFEVKTGYSLDEMIGKKPGKMLHGPKTDPKHIKANRAGLRAKKIFTQEILNYSKSGETYWVSITFNPIFNDKKELVNYIAVETEITHRKEQEEKLRESEERLQFVLKGSEIGYWDWNAATGQMTVNEQWYEMLGYKSSDFKPSIDKWHSFVHPEDMLKLEKIMETIFPDPSKNEFSVEIRAKHKSGRYVWILDRGAVVSRGENGAPLRISGVHIDATERKLLETELEEERNFLNNIINVSALSLVIISKSGEITFANSGAEHILGLDKDTIEKKRYNDPDWQHITLDDEPFPVEELPFPKVLNTKRPVKDIQHGLIWKDGTKKYISITGLPFTVEHGEVEDVIFSISDITEKVLANRELSKTQMRLNNILGDMSDVIWSRDLNNRGFNYITPSIEKLTGYPQANYLNSSMKDMWKKCILKSDLNVFEKSIKELERKGEFAVEYRIKTKAGVIKWVLNKGQTIYDESKAIRVDGIITDITKRKQSEHKNQEYLQIVEDQNDRLKNFTYIVSHNLRSHSANIQGLMHLINSRHQDIAENQFVKLLNTASTKLDDTLHHLNNVVSVVSTTDEMSSINLHEAVTSFYQTFENFIAESDIAFINEVPKNIYVEAVPAFLESIIANLLTNAINYRDDSKSNPFVKIKSRKLKGVIIIMIEDNGLGIDLEKYGEKLFGMYKTFHTHEKSRGLGLFLTKNQIETMGGKIDVESQVGVGTKFKVCLKDGNI